MSSPTEIIIQNLWDPSVQNDSRKLVELIEPIPSLIEAGNIETEPLISPMIRLLGSHNAEVKEHVCSFLLKLSSHQGDVGVLAQNILMQDTQDPNPRIRSVAISTLCSLPSLNAETKDPCDSKIPDILRESGLIDTLYSIIKDPDPGVLTFSLQTLNIILEDEGGIVIPRSMAQYILSRLNDLPELELCFVIDYLQKYYTLKKEEESMVLMNALDPFLDSKNGAFFYVTLINGFCSQLCKFLRKSSLAIQIMDFISLLNQLGENEALSISKELRFKNKDSTDILCYKARLLSTQIRKFASNDLKKEIDAYLLKFCLTSSEPKVEKELILALCDAPRQDLIDKIEKNLSRNSERKLALLKPILELIRHFKSLTSNELINLIWIINEYSHILEDSPYILDMLWNQREAELQKYELLSLFLSATLKVFVFHPLATQITMGIVLEKISMVEPDLRERVEFYCKLLRSPTLLSKIISQEQ
ncbi:AP4B1 [Lepeophtheirus salmonis]|uniref:AP4B1 n=1 Tax=Lepeophtheirus salmonis TaxID=72036 RepID=A0A7R8CCF9_LEPSM|nr:AP4B1 [Lepeophtheirus salmonis]CAF2770795.1 AP4B1 [Lepeophtheirus salmonis]